MNKLQEFVQEKCVMAAHPECKTLDEALKKELYLDNTVLIYDKRIVNLIDKINEKIIIINWKGIDIQVDMDDIKIIGLPCTLSRVLNVLSKTKHIFYFEFGNFKNKLEIYYENENNKPGQCRLPLHTWKLSKEDGSECLFEDQTEGTQLAIAKLLGWKE